MKLIKRAINRFLIYGLNYENLDEGISVVLFNFRLNKDGLVSKNPEGTLLHVYSVSKQVPKQNVFSNSGSNTENEIATKWHTHQSPCCSLVIDEQGGSFYEKVIEFESEETQLAWERAKQPDLTNVKLDERPVDSSHEDIENNIAHKYYLKKRKSNVFE